MRRLRENRFVIILLASGGLIALVLLSAALRGFTFQPPEPLAFSLGGLPSMAASGYETEIPLWKFLLFGAVLLLIFGIILVFMDAEYRKQFLLRMLRSVLSMVALWMILNYAYERGTLQQALGMIPIGELGQSVVSQGSTPEYVPPPQINPWLVFAVSFVVAVALVLLVWFIYTHRSRPRAAPSLDEIAGIAREALDGLQPGRDWDEAIVRAYVRMSEVATAERGLIRQPGTTPSEFALRMERAGLPGEAVRSLTRLFESVRYGGRNSSPADRDLAAAALGAILHACGVRA